MFLALILTICTDPGRVPQDHEYDLPEPNSEKDRLNTSMRSSRTSHVPAGALLDDLTNEEIDEDLKYKVDPTHFDFAFIKSKQGPLYQLDDSAALLKKKKKRGQP